MPGLSRDINRLARGTPEFDIIEGLLLSLRKQYEQ